MRGAGYPSLAAKLTENAADLGFKLIAGQNTDRGLNADSAHYGKGIGVFIEIEIVRHSRALLPRVEEVDSELGEVIGDL